MALSTHVTVSLPLSRYICPCHGIIGAAGVVGVGGATEETSGSGAEDEAVCSSTQAAYGAAYEAAMRDVLMAAKAAEGKAVAAKALVEAARAAGGGAAAADEPTAVAEVATAASAHVAPPAKERTHTRARATTHPPPTSPLSQGVEVSRRTHPIFFPRWWRCQPSSQRR